jgi:DNA-binding response OmpR family regulator
VPSLIVLAEDNLELRHLLAMALGHDGYRVVEAATGDALVSAVSDLVAAGESPDLIISDVRMPRGSGIEAGRTLRATGVIVPMIFMTAYGDIWTRSLAAQLGAVLLDKPLALDVLRQAVERVLAVEW